MNFIQVLLIAIGLAMDAFAVSICKGLNIKNKDYKYSAILAFFFGLFQAIMPIIGWLLGTSFSKFIGIIDNLVGFVLLVAIGGKMICEAFEKKEIKSTKYDYKEIIMLSVATSIDALAVGIMFAVFNVDIIISSLIIGIVAFVFSFIGVNIGSIYGVKHEERAEILGGIVLILIGMKLLFT